MLQFGAPSFLLAGALLALIPVVLHLIAPRPAARAPLPTARFLRPDPRTRLRLRRTPRDVGLMALRVLFVLLIAAALARPVVVPERRGGATIVLLDAGQSMASVWAEALDSTRALLRDASRGAVLVVFHEMAEIHDGARIAELLDSLAAAGPASTHAAYATAFEALHAAAARLPSAESASAHLVTYPRRDAWSDGLATLRAAAWPGRIGVVALKAHQVDAPAAGGDAGEGVRRASIVSGDGGGRFVEAALLALGWDARISDAGDAPGNADAATILLDGTALDAALLERAGAGAIIVASGEVARADPIRALPWDAAPDGGAVRGGDLHFAGGLRIPGAAWLARGRPSADARVLAVWDDGDAAAAAVTRGRGCVVYVATPLEAGALPMSPEFPHALERLLAGCADARSRAGEPLDSGAVDVLAGPSDAPATVALASFAGIGAGAALWRWLLAAALTAAIAETLLARRAPRRPT